MTIHEFYISQVDFGAYLLGFKNDIIIDSVECLNVRDFVVLRELSITGEILTGNHRLFEITDIDLHFRVIKFKEYSRLVIGTPKDYPSVYSQYLKSRNANGLKVFSS